MSNTARLRIADDPNVVTIEQVADWLGYLLPDDGSTEIRAIYPDGRIVSRVFAPREDRCEIATYALAVSKRAKAVYFTLNPVRENLARDRAANDGDVIRRHLLLIDLDPERPAHTSATADEKAAAWGLAREVQSYLRGQLWPDPTIVDSGNGYHLLYRIDVPNTEESDRLVKNALYALSRRFSDAAVKVDRGVHNASRISKVPGTVTRKGPSTDDRPHRVSRLIENGPKEIVPREALEALAAEWTDAKAAIHRDTGKSPRVKTVTHGSGNGAIHRDTSEADVRSALDALPNSYASDYEPWLGVCMSLQAWDSVRGLDLAHEFSRRCPEKYDADELDYKWSTFTADGGRTIATVFAWAMESGWLRPARRVKVGKPTQSKASPDALDGHGYNGLDPEAAPTAPDRPPQTGAAIILTYLRERYRPAFRRGNSVACQDGEMLTMGVACGAPTSELIARLEAATDTPRANNEVNRARLPGFFRTWAPVAWGDLLASLPDEDTAELGADAPAMEEFRRLVREAMLSEVVLGDIIGSSGVTQTERRSLVDWCQRFAKTGPWRSIRSKKCWCKLRDLGDGEVELAVAIRHELFAQIGADRRLREMSANTFARRAQRYGVGTTRREDRPHGLAAITLHRELVQDLLANTPEGDDAAVEEGGA